MSSSTKKKENNTSKYVAVFIIFLALGVSLGVFFTYKYLNSKEEDVGEPAVDTLKDITNNKDYESIINNLYSVIKDNVIFYDSNGTSIETMDNTYKLRLVYKYITSVNKYPTETLQVIDYTNNSCSLNFVVDSNSTSICTISRISTSEFQLGYKKLFNDTNIDVSRGFFIDDFKQKQCRMDGTDYVCGYYVNKISATGSLTPKFSIVKVILEDNGDIVIYDKGYLVDTRSNVVPSNDGYDNHYLHTSDSTTYYYELKSSDNVTFKHTFKLASDNNYYYNNTVVATDEE